MYLSSNFQCRTQHLPRKCVLYPYHRELACVTTGSNLAEQSRASHCLARCGPQIPASSRPRLFLHCLLFKTKTPLSVKFGGAGTGTTNQRRRNCKWEMLQLKNCIIAFIYLYLFAERDYDVHIFDRRRREWLKYAGELDARSSSVRAAGLCAVQWRGVQLCTVWPAGSSPPPAWLDREQRPNQTPSSSPACPTSRPAVEPRPPRSSGSRWGRGFGPHPGLPVSPRPVAKP